ncbi:MAG: hypothetical protein K0R71_149 [Bacillales bacterium]|jgi:hypothetical protein|nr:hypothetical protein [Bacillales bacterium]
MASFVYPLILIISFLFLMKKGDETESNFPLKIIGYFILGSFAFKINQISLPLGFVVYLLFFFPKLNEDVKRKAAVFGVLTFLLTFWSIPFVIEKWENRPTYIDHQLGSVYTMNFQKEYELVKKQIRFNKMEIKLEDFRVNYNKDGRITEIGWQLRGQNGSGYNLYQISYNFSKNKYIVTYNQVDNWLQYNRLIGADHFFETLILLDIKDITHNKGDFSSYGIQSTGERTNYEMKNKNHFVILNREIKLLDDEKLPVEGYYISTYAIKKTGEVKDKRGNITQESFEGTEASDYLFDVEYVVE